MPVSFSYQFPQGGKMHQNQYQGMPRGWEVFARDATDGQSRHLLARLTRDGPILPDGTNARPGDDKSHSALMYWKEPDGRTRMGIEFTEHLKSKDSGERAFRDGGMPCYGRYLVTDEQIQRFIDEFPDKRAKLQGALSGYAADQPGTQGCPGIYVCSGRPGRPVEYIRSEVKAVPNIEKYDVGRAVRNVAGLLRRELASVEKSVESSTPRHRIMFRAVREPGAFKDSPIAPKYPVDAEGVERLLGDRMTDGKYMDGYRITCEFAMDNPMKNGDSSALSSKFYLSRDGELDMESMFDEPDGVSVYKGMPNGTYLSNYYSGGQVRHDILVTPDLMAEYLVSSRYEQKDGAYVGVTEAAVYPMEQQGAFGTELTFSQKDGPAARRSVMDGDYPDSRAQVQNRDRLEAGGIQERPPAGCVWGVDMMSRTARVPEEPLDLAAHERFARIQRYRAQKLERLKSDPEYYDACLSKQQGQGRVRDTQAAIDNARGIADGVGRMRVHPGAGFEYPF